MKKILYHGTNRDFKKFNRYTEDETNLLQEIFFTASPITPETVLVAAGLPSTTNEPPFASRITSLNTEIVASSLSVTISGVQPRPKYKVLSALSPEGPLGKLKSIA